jgi:hypothetical protein
MGSATTRQQFIRQVGAAPGVSAFVLASTVGSFRLGLLLLIAVSAGAFACMLGLPSRERKDVREEEECRKGDKGLRDRTTAFCFMLIVAFRSPNTTDAQLLGTYLPPVR